MSFATARVRWFVWKIAPIAMLTALVILILLLVKFFFFTSDTTDDSTAKDQISPSTEATSEAVSEPSTTDSSDLLSKKQTIKNVVENCVEKFYYRDSTLLAGDNQQATDRLRQNLEPFVTESFLESYVSPPLSAKADYDFRDAGGKQRVEKVTFTGDGDPSIGVEVEVDVVVSIPGYETNRYTKFLSLTLEADDQKWVVSSLIEE